jgi:hypothetical protein
MRKFVSRNPLFFAFIFPAMVDGFITLLGQDSTYWSNRVVNEASPAYYALVISPWLFTIGSIFWFIFWYWVFKKLKEPLNIFLMFLFIAGHSWGSSSWFWKIMGVTNVYSPSNQLSVMFAWGIVILYFALIAIIATYGMRIYIEREK